MFDIKYKILLFLAKYFGIAEYNNRLCIANEVYVSDIDREEDNIIEYKSVRGLQIFPYIKKVDNFPLRYGSMYRKYIEDKVK